MGYSKWARKVKVSPNPAISGAEHEFCNSLPQKVLKNEIIGQYFKIWRLLSLSLIYKHNKVLVYDEKPESWAVLATFLSRNHKELCGGPSLHRPDSRASFQSPPVPVGPWTQRLSAGCHLSPYTGPIWNVCVTCLSPIAGKDILWEAL